MRRSACLLHILVHLFLVHLVFAEAVDVKVMRVKQKGNSGNRFSLKGRCKYRLPEAVGSSQFDIVLSKATTKFKSSAVEVLSTISSAYRVRNKKKIKKVFKVVFTLEYTGQEVPTGFCSDLEIEALELLQNNDMEAGFHGNWFCHSDCDLEHSNDSYSGLTSVKVFNRNRIWKGLSQAVAVTGNRYRLSGFVKLLTLVGDALYHEVDFMMACSNVEGDTQYVRFGNNKMVQRDIWTEISAAVLLPTGPGYNSCTVYVQMYGETAEYLVDHMSLQEVPDLVDWKTAAMKRIETLRKAKLCISLGSPASQPSDQQIHITQTRHDFAFGSAVGATEIVDPTFKKYQDFFYDNYEWATIENALKWKQMEKIQMCFAGPAMGNSADADRSKGVINYDKPYTAIQALRANGIKVRGHHVFQGPDHKIQDWVDDLNQQQFLEAVQQRIQGVISNTTSLLEHWDVNNENLHGQYFEKKSGDVNITMQIFRDVHAIDPNAKLFLNDYEIIERRNKQKATAMKVQASMFKESGVPIYGVGIQSHIKNANLDITAMKARLDELAGAGLPIWITELSIEEEDVVVKAHALEDVLYLYFSHPAVEGVIFWGFWDGKIFQQSARLVEGQELTPNQAGLIYQRLFKEEWRTVETKDIMDEEEICLKGFKGDYSIKLMENGQLIHSENVVLTSDGLTVDMSI